MQVIHHVLISSVVGFFVFFMEKISFFNMLIFIFGGIIIDADHFLFYWYHNKKVIFNYSIVKRWCFQVGYKFDQFYLFHTLWFFLFLFFLKGLYPVIWFLFLGVSLHYFLDILADIYWCYYLKKIERPYRRWVAPGDLLKKVHLEKYL